VFSNLRQNTDLTGNDTKKKLSTISAELNNGGAEGSSAHRTTTLLIYIAQRRGNRSEGKARERSERKKNLKVRERS
jgi:hypothetical protein